MHTEARDVAADTEQFDGRSGHENEASHIGIEPGERHGSLRALKCQQGTIRHCLNHASMADVRDQVRNVFSLARRVDD